MIFASLTIVLLAAAPNAAAPADGSAFDQIVAAERAFAALSATDGLHAAFVANFAADGVVFDPVPTNGRAAHEGKPRSKGTLSWGPAWAAVASAGDIGFTTGPWEYRVAGDGAPLPSTGWFFTAWRKQPDGTWKVEADLGVTAPLKYLAPSTVSNGWTTPELTRLPRPSDAAAARAAIATAEHLLGTAGAKGIGTAVQAVADEAIRVYRDGAAPADGLLSSTPLLAADRRTATCVAARVAASASGNIGYAYGTCTPVGTDADRKFGYLRVWRRQADGTWRVFVDVTP